MPRICPYCQHIRKDNEIAPDWQCPACERAYAKGGNAAQPVHASSARPAPVSRRREPDESVFGKWLLILAVLAGAAWLWNPLNLAMKPSAVSAQGNPANGQPQVVLYATSWCGYCAATRKFFEQNQIEYTEYDIEKNAAAAEEHRQLGGNGVPLIVVGDTVIHGYNQVELRRALRL
jgi:glutaredoxin